MKLKAWPIVSDAVERGIEAGHRRAYKHTDEPQYSHISEEIFNEVMAELAEIIDFDEDDLECKPTQ